MFDNILNEIKQALGPQLQQEAQLDQHQAHQAIDLTHNSLRSNIQGLIGGNSDSGASGIESLMSGGTSNMQDPAMHEQLSNGIASNLSQKMGISSDRANSLVGMIVPFIMNHFMNRQSESNLQNTGSHGGLMEQLKGLASSFGL